MYHRIKGVFQRYVQANATVRLPGRDLADDEGDLIGQIDSISARQGVTMVQGWTSGDLVRLSDDHAGPGPSFDLTDRHDRQTGQATFQLAMPLGTPPKSLWVEKDGETLEFPLPAISETQLQAARRAQILPFLSAAMKSLPATVNWAITRSPDMKARVLANLGLSSTAVEARMLETRLFDAAPEAAVTPTGTAITIILPIYNAFDLLPEVLQRVLDHTDLPWRLIMIEDCSTDPALRPWLQDWHRQLPAELHGRVQMILHDQNMGFIRSVNEGLAIATEFGDHVVLLNSDAMVPVDWASRLLRPFFAQHNVATVTPHSNDAEIYTTPVICQRYDLQPGEADALDLVARRLHPDLALAEAPTGVGFCMAMSPEFIGKLPTLDTIFGRGYGEEVDWCQRARALGGRHIATGNLFVEHRGGTSFGSAEKMRLIEQNNRIVSSRYPTYDQEVQDFIRCDPLLSSRLALGIAWASLRQADPIPVYLAHVWGGGAELYLKQRIGEDLSHGSCAIVLRVGGHGARWHLELHTPWGVTSGDTDDAAFLCSLIGLAERRRIVYSCGVGDRDPTELPDLMLALSDDGAQPIEVLVHDFFPVSPSYTLLNADGRWRGVPTGAGRADCAHSQSRPDGTTVTLDEWQQNWGRLLLQADDVVVFSQNSRDIIAAAYPVVTERIRVRPHKPLGEVAQAAYAPSGERPVIGVLGNLNKAKGAAVLQDLSQALAKSGQAKLVLLGNLEPGFQISAPSKVHGSYDRTDITALAEYYGISCWLIPSIWPETFSYTTHEALATGLPVFAFDLGAQGATVTQAAARTGQGGVIALPDDNDYTMQIIRHILAGKKDRTE